LIHKIQILFKVRICGWVHNGLMGDRVVQSPVVVNIQSHWHWCGSGSWQGVASVDRWAYLASSTH